MVESRNKSVRGTQGVPESPEIAGSCDGDKNLTHSAGGDRWRHTRTIVLLKKLGVNLPKSARILDFGCGDGESIEALSSLGYVNTEGYDFSESPLLSDRRDKITLGSFMNLRLPYADDSFDLVISQQVFEHVLDQTTAFSEIYRITKPGGHGLHFIPARYGPVESHVKMPFGGVMQHRWWYKMWASIGVRNSNQKEWTSDEVADLDAYFAVDATRYVPNSCYQVIWRKIGFGYRFAEEDYFLCHPRQSRRALGRGGPPVAWLYRTMGNRVVYLHKPVSPVKKSRVWQAADTYIASPHSHGE